LFGAQVLFEVASAPIKTTVSGRNETVGTARRTTSCNTKGVNHSEENADVETFADFCQNRASHLPLMHLPALGRFSRWARKSFSINDKCLCITICADKNSALISLRA
jgi:hypothetical protein